MRTSWTIGRARQCFQCPNTLSVAVKAMEYCGFAKAFETWRCSEEFSQQIAGERTPLGVILAAEELISAVNYPHPALIA
jgi:hypothetical protein